MMYSVLCDVTCVVIHNCSQKETFAHNDMPLTAQEKGMLAEGFTREEIYE